MQRRSGYQPDVVNLLISVICQNYYTIRFGVVVLSIHQQHQQQCYILLIHYMIKENASSTAALWYITNKRGYEVRKTLSLHGQEKTIKFNL